MTSLLDKRLAWKAREAELSAAIQKAERQTSGQDFSDLRIFTGADLLSLPPIESIPVLGHPGFIGRGLAHVLAAYPKVGKTTLIASVIGDALKAGDTVLYFSEESQTVWANRLGGALWEGVTFVEALGASQWKMLAYIGQHPASIVVVDTLRNVLAWKDENDNAAVNAAVSPWIQVCRETGKTFIGLHHTRKAPGTGGRAIAGGHGLLAAFDQAVEITEAENGDRKVSGFGRIGQAQTLRYALEDGVLVPKAGPEVAGGDVILSVLRASDRPMTKNQIAAKAELSPKTTERRLKVLVATGEVREAGKHGNATLYVIGLEEVA